MFDQYAQELLTELPKLDELTPAECRRALSEAYLLIIEARLAPTNSNNNAATRATIHKLRRLANTLESVAIFDQDFNIHTHGRTTQAAAFAAAEALHLIAGLSQTAPTEIPKNPFKHHRTYALFESALLFMVGGYDINATTVVRDLDGLTGLNAEDLTAEVETSRKLWRRLKNFCSGNIRQIEDGPWPTPQDLDDHVSNTRTTIYQSLGKSIDQYSAWLGGSDTDVGTIIDTVKRVRDACRSSANGVFYTNSEFADGFHLASLILAAINHTRTRALVKRIIPPNSPSPEYAAQFRDYLFKRAQGAVDMHARPFLWPTALEYVEQCLPGPHRDAVVTMPTGSGKSFLAEMAAAQALARGWVLYLAPTNALAHQVRRDLKIALRSFKDTTVSAFIGGAEYSAGFDDTLNTDGLIAVMTPEKCALALRLHPELFKNCALCIFDECHLLNDRGRGATADLLIAQLFHFAPKMSFLLMSAMVSNPEELAAWLSEARNQTGQGAAFASKIRWRPSRAARGFVFLEEARTKSAIEEGKAQAAAFTKAKTIKYEIPLAWMANLSGPWTDDGPSDYRAECLPMTVPLEVKRSKDAKVRVNIDSWKNSTGLKLSHLMASRGLPTINFVLSSRHHAFSSAVRALKLTNKIKTPATPGFIGALLHIADVELGVETALRGLLSEGIAVHTSAMLHVEQTASEWMFTEGHAKLMVATGTLAQGLNFPALAVVVSGSQLANQFDLNEADAAAGITRANELILNGFGRAGRPGFANQGVVFLVSDKPYSGDIGKEADGAQIRTKYGVLGEPDASITVASPIEQFIDQLMLSDQALGATGLELVITSQLASSTADGGESAAKVLKKTFGGHRKRAQFTNESAAAAELRIAEIRATFLEGHGVPAWMPLAAMRAGVDFLRAQKLWSAYLARGLVEADKLASLDTLGWFKILIETLSMLPPADVIDYLDNKKTPTPRTALYAIAKKHKFIATTPWSRPNEWLEAWKELGGVVELFMRGASYAQIGAALFSVPIAEFDSSRGDGGQGIPAVFKFIGDVVDRALAIDAGCLLAMIECWLTELSPDAIAPEALGNLPQCIRNGAHTLDVLAWFKFGYRQRSCAHAFAQEFPLDPWLSTDEERADAVRQLRRAFIDETDAVRPPLLTSAKIAITHGYLG